METNECKNCKNFKVFYTKDGTRFTKHFLGQCIKHNVISEEENSCPFWEKCGCNRHSECSEESHK